MTDPIVIRNLQSLQQDMVDCARNILHAIHEYEHELPVGGPPPDVEKMIEAVERNARTLLQFLTGIR